MPYGEVVQFVPRSRRTSFAGDTKPAFFRGRSRPRRRALNWTLILAVLACALFWAAVAGAVLKSCR